MSDSRGCGWHLPSARFISIHLLMLSAFQPWECAKPKQFASKVLEISQMLSESLTLYTHCLYIQFLSHPDRSHFALSFLALHLQRKQILPTWRKIERYNYGDDLGLNFKHFPTCLPLMFYYDSSFFDTGMCKTDNTMCIYKANYKK